MTVWADRTERWVPRLLAATGAILVLLAVRHDYLFFHFLAEVFSIVIACGIFIVAWHNRRFFQTSCFVLLGVAYLHVGILDLLHTITYEGMAVYLRASPDVAPGADPAIEFWIAARYMESLSLLAAIVLVDRYIKPHWLLTGYSAVTAFLFASIYWWGVFPACFIEGEGLTTFKVYSEYAVAIILVGTIGLLLKRQEYFAPRVLYLLIASAALTILGEMAFTLYIGMFGNYNVIGHICKVASFFLIYKATIQTGLEQPYDLIFRDLKRAEEQAAAASAAKSRFVAQVSHELRTPINGVLGVMQMLARSPLNARQQDLLNTAQQAGDVLMRLISDLLDLSRLEAGKLVFEHETFRFKDAIDQVGATLKPVAENKGLALRVEVADNIPEYLEGPRERLQQVLYNLLGNAIKFTRQGQCAVKVIREEVEQSDLSKSGSSSKAPVKLHFMVADTGPGIPTEDQERIFEAFTQSASVSSADQKGSGLGLAIVRQLVDQLGGRVWIESEVGRGTTVHFTAMSWVGAAITVEDEPDVDKSDTAAVTQQTLLHILVGEDDAINQTVLSNYLTDCGHCVDICGDGDEVMGWLQQNSCDLILMDMEMPRVNGVEATRRIRAGESGEDHRNLPIIGMTAHASAQVHEQLLQAGMNLCLTKPLHLQQLDEAIQSVARCPDWM